MNYWTRRWKDLSRHQIFEAFVYGASGAYSLRSLDSKKYVSSHIFYWLQIFKVEFKTARMQLSWRNSWRGFWRKKADLASQSTYLGLLGRFKKEFEVSFAKSISQHQTLLVIGLLKRWRFSGKTSKTSKTKEALEMLFKSITDSSSLFRSGKRPSQVSTWSLSRQVSGLSWMKTSEWFTSIKMASKGSLTWKIKYYTFIFLKK